MSAWELWDPPDHWKKYDVFVIADGCKADGTRQHVISEPHVPEGTVWDNAEIFGSSVLTRGKPCDQQS